MAIFVAYKQTRMEVLVFSGVRRKKMEQRGGSGGVDLL